jgi:hypothetical protein
VEAKKVPTEFDKPYEFFRQSAIYRSEGQTQRLDSMNWNTLLSLENREPETWHGKAALANI